MTANKSILIVEDDQNISEYLQNVVTSNFTDLELLGAVDNVLDAIKLINSQKPDILLMDVEIRGGTSFDILENVKENDFNVIFSTAYDKYAIKAIKFAAMDYLLKPVPENELVEAIKKVQEFKSQQSQKIDHLLQNLNEKPKVLGLSMKNYITYVDIEDIIMVEADGSYCTFFLANGDKHVVSKGLKHYSEILTEYNFYRCHNSQLVNLTKIKKVLLSDGGSVELDNGLTAMISRARKKEFLAVLEEFH